MPDRTRTRARELAAQFTAKGDPLGWFEALYREAESGATEIPWADRVPNPNLLDFWKLYPQESRDKSALIIGSGLGDDAEQLAAWGFQTTAFDISATAIIATKNASHPPTCNMSLPICWPRPNPGARSLISSSSPTPCNPFPQTCARGHSSRLRNF